ncbi:hypothetical protein GW17_00043058 [Ensete ventricosum]|nr:hypothetical protein GW17_00043058 [Ensete ventricosum]
MIGSTSVHKSLLAQRRALLHPPAVGGKARRLKNWSHLHRRPFACARRPRPTSTVFVAMLFSWFGVHVEDHARDAILDFFYGVDMGVAGKTWSGLPGMPGLSFPVVDLLQDYDGEV